MDSGSQVATDGGDGRSGGKILKRRRTAARKTPYDRPTPPLQPENPNWLNGLVFPAKFVAGGASKLLSSFWNPKSWGSPSSSSDTDSDSEGGIEDDYEDSKNLSDEGVELNQKKCSLSVKSEILYLVEQLLMLDRFSREECDRLIEIINSRVVDYTITEGVDAGPSKIPSEMDIGGPNICNQAIMEARKLITKNMGGSSSKSDLVMMPHRDYLSSGSWIIQDEIQQLRYKATEDMLSNHRSPKLAALTAEHGFSEPSLANDKAVEVIKPNKPIYLEAPKPEDETVNLASEGGTHGLSDMRTTPDDIPTKALSSLPTLEEQNQMAEEQDAASNNSHHAVHPDSEQNPRQSREVISLGKEKDDGQSDERNLDLEISNNDNRVADDVKGNCDLITESTEVPEVNEAIGNVNGSQVSSNTNDPSSTRKANSPTVRRAGTRNTRYSRRGRGRGK